MEGSLASGRRARGTGCVGGVAGRVSAPFTRSRSSRYAFAPASPSLAMAGKLKINDDKFGRPHPTPPRAALTHHPRPLQDFIADALVRLCHVSL